MPGKGILDKGAQALIGRSISDNMEDIHVRNRLDRNDCFYEH